MLVCRDHTLQQPLPTRLAHDDVDDEADRSQTGPA